MSRIRFGNTWKSLIAGCTLVLLIISGGGRHEVTAVEDSYERLKVFTEVLSLIQANYVEETKPRDLIYGGIKGMLETLDAHSSFLPPIWAILCRLALFLTLRARTLGRGRSRRLHNDVRLKAVAMNGASLGGEVLRRG